MCVALVGGMDRLEGKYREEARKRGVSLRVFNRARTGMDRSIRRADALVIFTDRVSHRAAREAREAARSAGMPVLMCHSSGICTLRDCLNCLEKQKGDRR